MSLSGLLSAVGMAGKRGPVFALPLVALPSLTDAMATEQRVPPDHIARIEHGLSFRSGLTQITALLFKKKWPSFSSAD